MCSIHHSRYWLALLAAAVIAPPGAAQQVLKQPQEGVLLLKHGTTLSGFITPAGDRYIVLLGESGEARVPAADVLVVVSNLQQAYKFRRSRLDDTLDARIELAQWCLQHEMPARAADQLLAAEQRFGRLPQLEAIHQRLVASARPAPARGSPSAAPEAIARTSFEKESPDFSSDNIDSFTSTVQPLLLNRCASGGCHNSRGTSQYVLFRPLVGQRITQRLTERNLLATLAYVDRLAPLESILLDKAGTAHGGSAAAPIQEREQKQLDVLAQWLRSFATQRTAPNPATVAPANELLYQAGPLPRAESEKPSDPLPANRSRGRIVEPAGDPFDPARFNQQHHGRS